MKKHLPFFIAVLFSTIIISCEKENISKEEIQKSRIEDIIPQQFIDSLNKMGLEIHTGTTPPNVEGVYEIKPYILDTSNFNDLAQPGYRFVDFVLKLYNQSSSDFSIQLIGSHSMSKKDTSIATAVSGSGNKFTVYGKIKSSKSADIYGIYAMVLSGEMENGNIKNYTIGIICIDDTHTDYSFLRKGWGRIAYDSDKISEKTTDEALSAAAKQAGPVNTLMMKSEMQ